MGDLGAGPVGSLIHGLIVIPTWVVDPPTRLRQSSAMSTDRPTSPDAFDSCMDGCLVRSPFMLTVLSARGDRLR
jgi:hypothetical protein